MKSILHEGASIVKAIEKAWKESGKPSEFTVNVLEVGEKNFLGLTKRPAVVSISYDPRKVARGPEKKELSHNYRGRQASAQQRGRNEQWNDQRGEQRQRREGERPQQAQRQQYPPASAPQQQAQQQRPVREQQPMIREQRQERRM